MLLTYLTDCSKILEWGYPSLPPHFLEWGYPPPLNLTWHIRRASQRFKSFEASNLNSTPQQELMDLKKINAVAGRSCLETKKVIDLVVYDPYVVSRVREIPTKFGNKVILEIEDEFQFFLPNQLQLYLTNEPQEVIALKSEAAKGTLLVEHIGDRKLKFSIRRDDPFYRELSPF